MIIILTTKRIFLGKFATDDVDLLFQLNNDIEVMKYITPGMKMNLSEVKNKSMPRILKSYNHGPEFGIWPAYLTETNDYIGWFQYEPDYEILNAVEIGWRIKRQYWGNGYATEVAKVLVKRGLDMGKSIVARAMIDNKASIKVMKNAGLKFADEFWGDYEPHSGKPDVRYELSS